MINVLHMYYDLLNLYGENANTRCIKDTLEKSKINVNVDLKSLNDKIVFNKYDKVDLKINKKTKVLYLSSGDKITEKNMYINKYFEAFQKIHILLPHFQHCKEKLLH